MSWRFIVDERGIETRLLIDADKNNAWTSLISVILSWILILWFLLINELL
jgi:hypothetical protein